jgi:hypothetical protein
MKVPGVRLIAMVGILFALGIATGQANVAFAAGEAREIEVPKEGKAAERAKKLWEASRPVILADAKANYPDAEYMKRLEPVYNTWTTLQGNMGGEDDRVGDLTSDTLFWDLIPDILGLLNDVYGWTGDPPEKRQERRNRRRKFVEKKIAELDKRVAALK